MGLDEGAGEGGVVLDVGLDDGVHGASAERRGMREGEEEGGEGWEERRGVEEGGEGEAPVDVEEVEALSAPVVDPAGVDEEALLIIVALPDVVDLVADLQYQLHSFKKIHA